LHDPLAPDRDGLGPGPARIDGMDVTAGEDEVGVRAGAG
jgi:hypothetical protein